MKIHTTSYGLPRTEGDTSSDAFAVRAWDETVIAVLSDGAGTGLPAREAAKRAVETLIENYSVKPRSWDPARALNEFTRLLNRSLYQESLARYERPEMVATLAVTVVEGNRLYGINVGDSRVTLWRNQELIPLSEDHVDAIQKNMLTRALGMEEEIEPHVFECELQDGDVTLLCSDGLSNHLDAEDMATAMQQRSSARSLVLDARRNASQETLDDISAVVMDIRQTGKLRTMNERVLDVPETLRKGDKVDGYELLRSFHGTDRVWLAEKDGLRVVIKFAPREARDSAAYLTAFTRETWNATRAQSEHFVRAHEPLGQTARYYVMQFVDAPSLQSVLRERLLSVDSAVALGRFLAEACQTLLRMDLAHGDIKPENILCAGDYARLSFKLVDLGSAVQVFSEASRAGTASYLAPERFRGAPNSERTEIFAIGVVLYQSLTGKLPYGSIERFQTPSFSAAKNLAKLNPNVPPWLETVVRRAIALKPERRYQHYSELAHDLANPVRVQPFFEDFTPLLERNPLIFYRTGFFILLVISLLLLFKLMTLS
ncbi:MAG: protein phosphatase 2C domain-containing protein [Verrucomicrobiota bacterium]